MRRRDNTPKVISVEQYIQEQRQKREKEKKESLGNLYVNLALRLTNFESAKASVAAEGYTITKDQENLVKLKMSGDISHEVFIERAIELSLERNRGDQL